MLTRLRGPRPWVARSRPRPKILALRPRPNIPAKAALRGTDIIILGENSFFQIPMWGSPTLLTRNTGLTVTAANDYGAATTAAGRYYGNALY